MKKPPSFNAGRPPRRRPANPGASWGRGERAKAGSAAPVLAQPDQPIAIDDLTHDGRGFGRSDGKACFIRGALPGERVTWRREASQRNFDEGVVVELLSCSPQRREPGCDTYPRCGGCSLRHLEPAAALGLKQAALVRDIGRAGMVVEEWLAPLQGEFDGYRRRARLAVQRTRDGRIELGFRNAASKRIEPISHCAVLLPALAALLPELPVLLADDCPIGVDEVELTATHSTLLVALTGSAGQQLNSSGAAKLAAAPIHASCAEPLQIWWRDAGERDYRPISPGAEPQVAVTEQLSLSCRPGQFLQVNDAVNRAMVAQVLALADGGELALDLFAGVGNFALPLAAHYRQVVAVEGLDELVASGRRNAERNGIANVEFVTADLNQPLPARVVKAPQRDAIDLLLIDPPRSGAAAAMEWIAKSGARQVVYISCHPATLLRDAAVLLAAGYRWRKAAALDMFPQTAHLEALALFERP